MTVRQFIASLTRDGVQLDLEGGKLRFQGPKRVLTATVLAQLKQRKPEIIDYLSQDREPPGSFALSHGQKALWLYGRLNPDSPAYHLMYAAECNGPVAPARLQEALRRLASRHGMLRTVFVEEGGEPRQREVAGLIPDFQEIQAEASLEACLDREADRPFQLTREPGLRLRLVHAGDRTVLLLVAHHIALDFHAMETVLRQLATFYDTGEDDLPAPAADYRQFVMNREAMLRGPRGQKMWLYWQEALRDPPPMLNLPLDVPRRARTGHQGAAFDFQMDAETSQKLRESARALGATPFVFLLAAFKAFLFRTTGQRDMLAVTPVSGRDLPEWEPVAGYFANPFPIRTRVEGRPDFAGFLKTVRHTFLAGLEHSAFPLPLMIERLQSEGVSSRHLFQVAFVWDQVGDQSVLGEGKGLPGRCVACQQRGADYDLALTFFEAGDILRGTWKYAADLFRAETVATLSRHFLNLLAGILADDQRPLDTYSLIDDDERQRLIVTWNDTEAPYPDRQCAHQLIRASAEAHPERPALEFLGTRQALSYRQLMDRAEQLAAALQREGVGAETIVGICLDRCLERVVATLAVLLAGGAFLPMDPHYPEERLALMAADSGAEPIITDARCRGNLPPLCRTFLWDEIPCEPRASDLPMVLPQQAAYCIYTSGSTGAPKGVLVTHQGLVNLMTAQNERFRVDNQSRMLQFSSFSFDASVWETFLALGHGACLCLAAAEDLIPGPGLANLMRAQRITHALLPPSGLPAMEPATCPAPANLVVGGEAISAELAERWSAGRRLLNAYGPTEATVCATTADISEAAARDSIGEPLPNIRVHVLDERLEPAAIGLPGELFIAGSALARGYLHRPDLTAARFLPDPFSGQGVAPAGGRLYRTGDLVRHASRGPDRAPKLLFLGRVDRQVKIRGFRIELGELEAALRAHPRVQNAVARPIRKPDGDILVAYVTSKGPARDLSPAILKLDLQKRLPAYLVPSAILVMDAFPITGSNKIDLAALPEPGAGTAARRDHDRFASETQRKLFEIWQSLLAHADFDAGDNFFEVGGHSLLLAKLQARIRESFNREVPLVELVQHPSIGDLARHLDGVVESAFHSPAPGATGSAFERGDVAIIGFACRFPGAPDADSFWHNLSRGKVSIRGFSDAEVLDSGVSQATAGHPNYVKSGGWLPDIDLFDAAFFGIPPKEAETMDPQHRLFLETAWAAMEHAGYGEAPADLAVGVYAGAGGNTYLTHQLLSHGAELETSAFYQQTLGNDKDFLATRVSYKLDLKGPSMSVQSACSTSLLAVHMARNALLAGECGMALAGGVSIRVPQETGYLFQEGMILSPDGQCRPFDQEARGTVPGNGLGIVVLKRLKQALADGDFIHAVIKGSAANNDGGLKAGYTAPASSGQAAVIHMALQRAGVAPETISYVEAHGTGTPLGDPVEIAALNQVFAAGQRALGSVKANLGHLDTAAGVAGLIKTVLMLRNRQLPPTPHFQQPNQSIDFSGFQVSAGLQPWDAPAPRRAGVSSFGIGGTNVHLVLEEAPQHASAEPATGNHLLLLSARTESALDATAANLAAYLTNHPQADLADVAFTLQAGRKAFPHRRVLLCEDAAEACRLLADPAAGDRSLVPKTRPVLVFMFPGQGSQFAGMGESLYRRQKVFREQLDRCAEIIAAEQGFDLRELLYGPVADAAERLERTEIAQPAIFAVSYATAEWWRSLGLIPDAVLGHSVGEYVAATLAGVFSLEDALRLVCARGRAMQALPAGDMLSVALGEAAIVPYLNDRLALAAVNNQDRCVVSGESAAVAALAEVLAQQGVACKRLRTSHAFHSHMMEPMLADFAGKVAQVSLHPPRVPLVSNLSGDWVNEAEITEPNYWVRHIREPVRFGPSIARVLERDALLLEVGPGRTLCQLAAPQAGRRAIQSLAGPNERDAEGRRLQSALSRLWFAGFQPRWQAASGQSRRRLPLPTYPFERKRFWVDAARKTAAPAHGGPSIYLPYWKPAPLPKSAAGPASGARYLVFGETGGLGAVLADRLMLAGSHVTLLSPRSGREDQLGVDPLEPTAMARLLREHGEGGPIHLVYAWGLTALPPVENLPGEFRALVFLCKALAASELTGSLTLITSGGVEVTGSENLNPQAAALQGPCLALALERPALACRVVDVTWPDHARGLAAAAHLLADELAGGGEPLVALRGRARWVPAYERWQAPDQVAELPKRPVVLITGGLGNMGLTLAAALTRWCRPKLILTGRTGLVAGEGAADAEAAGRKRAAIQAMESAGAEVIVVAADVADAQAMAALLAEMETRLGALSGVIHAAGDVGLHTFQPLAQADLAHFSRQFQPKVSGIQVLDRLLADRPLAFRVCLSSLAAETGGPGLAAYAAANRFMDHFLCRQNRDAPQPWLTIDWDGWSFPESTEAITRGIAPADGVRLFRALLANDRLGRVLVTMAEPAGAARGAGTDRRPSDRETPRRSSRPRQAQTAPRNEHERLLCETWQQLLGLDSVGSEDDFFDLGGDSLMATRVLFRIKERLGVTLTLAHLFEHPTPATLATLLAGLDSPLAPTDETIPLLGLTHGLPLSAAQQRFWFLDQLGHGGANILPGGLMLQGALDAKALARGLADLVERHDILRSRYSAEDGQPRFEVAPAVAIPLPHIDLSGLSEAAGQAALASIEARDAATPFALDQAPLLRARLLRLDRDTHALLLTLHHLVADGWSLGIILGELGAAYSARRRGQSAVLPPLPLQYSDYAVWQGPYLESVAGVQSAYWARRLAGLPALLELPADRTRGRQGSSRQGILNLELGPDLLPAVQNLAKNTGTTLFMIAQAAFALFLGRTCNQSDVVVATPIANRGRRALDGLVGCFLNTLMLRHELDLASDTMGFLKQVRAANLEDFGHADVPVERVLEALDVPRDGGYNPGFQVMFTLHSGPMPAFAPDDLKAQPLLRQVLSSPLDLALELEVTADGLRGFFKYSVALFDRATVASMARRFQCLLLDLTRAEATVPLYRLRLMTAAEQTHLLEKWNASEAAFPLQGCFPERFRENARRVPDAIAAVCDDARLTYAALDERVQRLAAQLAAMGMGAEKIVALYAPRDLDFLTAVMAIMACGATYLPLDPLHPPERQALILAQGQPALVLSKRGDVVHLLPALELMAVLPALVLLEDQATAASVPRIELPPILPQQRAYILFTSGSTGLPKGAMLCHDGMLNHLYAKVRDLDMQAGDRLAQNASQCFDISVWQLLAALLVGGQVHIYSDEVARHPRHLLQRSDRDGITILEVVPSMLQAMLAELEENAASAPAFAHLRWLMLTGEALPPSLATAWLVRYPKIPIVNAYGPTECSDDISHHVIRRPPPLESPHIPIGTPVMNMRLYVLDRFLQPVPMGVPGQLFAAGIGVGRGYLNRPARTAATFIPDPFGGPGSRLYQSGDLVRLLPTPGGTAGALVFLGRIDGQVKLRGFRIELGEIEAALHQHARVVACTVLVSTIGTDKRIVAYAVCEPGPGDGRLAEDLRTFLKQRLPDYMLPAAFVFLERMPLTPNGKLDRRALPPPQWAAAGESTAPVGEMQRRLADLWAAVLERDSVGTGDNFFDLGGNSLSATRLLSRLQRDFGLELALRDFFEEPTIQALAARLEAKREPGTSPWPLRRVARTGALPLSFAQQRLWFFEHLQRDGRRYIMPFAIEILGYLDPHRLQSALQSVMSRHEVLRTRFLSQDGQAYQVVDAPGPFPLAFLDFSDLDEARAANEIERLAAREAKNPFDLERGPLLRAHLLRLPTGASLLLLHLHHIAFDGWSGDILYQELHRSYHAGEQEAGPPAIQYADFAYWQRHWFDRGMMDPLREFWKRQMSGAPELQLPYPASQPMPSGNDLFQLDLDRATLERAKHFCREQRVTLFTFLLAVYKHLLFALTDQTDLVVGTDFANRGRVELEGLIGFFVNMLPLRTRAADNPAFTTFLQRVGETLLTAEANQALPFDRLVQDLGVARDSGGQPLVRSIFVLENAAFEGGRFGDLRWKPRLLERPEPKFDLSVFATEMQAGLRLVFAYRGGMFADGGIPKLARQYARLLEHDLSNPEAKLDLFPARGDEEEQTQMQKKSQKAFKLKNLREARRQSVNTAPQALVTRSFPAGEERLPLMISPVRDDVDLAEWARLDREQLERDLLRYGAILLRGFDIQGNQDFSRFAAAACDHLFGSYGDLPEEDRKLKVYKSTPYPKDKTILFHNESSHMHRWPSRQFFYCAQACEQGGETPLVDCRSIYRELPPDLIARLRDKGLRYMRNFSPGLDVSWQDFFKTEEPAQVEAFCREAGMACEWVAPDRLRVFQKALAILDHPVSGEPCFFNQVQLHHISCLDHEVRRSMQEVWSEDAFPRNVYFGDGTPIPEQVMETIDALYWKHAVALPWQTGDIIMLDNMLVAHARNPFEGERKIVVAMGDMVDSPLVKEPVS